MEYEIYKSDELTHWGVRGMKWGIRRYQNKDGSLTAAGKKRYNAELAKVREQEKIVKNRESVKGRLERLKARQDAVAERKKALDEADGKKVKDEPKGVKGSNGGKKSVKDMTDAELNEAINRARMEDTYRQLRPEQIGKQNNVFNRFIKGAVEPAAMNAGKTFIEKSLNKLGDKILGDKIDPNSLEGVRKTWEKLDYQNKIDRLKNPDKYKTTAEKKLEFQLEKDKADREAKMKGYNDAPDEARAKREADAAAAKANADAAARRTNEFTSNAYYNSTYNNKGVGTETVGRGRTAANTASSNLPATTSSVPSSTKSIGQRTVSGLLNGPVGSSSVQQMPSGYKPSGKEIGYLNESGEVQLYDN